MNKIIHLSLARKSVPIFMDIVQGTTAPAIEFILDDYTPPANARARIYIKKEGGEVYNDCTLSGNVVTYTPTAGSFDVAGQCVAQLEFVQSSTVIVSWRIFVTVEPNLIMGSAAPASTEFGALTELIQNAQKYDVVMAANNITGANGSFGWTRLTSGQDVNSIITAGIYSVTTDSVAKAVLNAPFQNAFIMTVRNEVKVNQALRFTSQRAETVGTTVTDHRVKHRFTTDAGVTWSEWIEEPLRSEVNAIANAGAKNLLPIGVNDTANNGQITSTFNQDGSVIINGVGRGSDTYLSRTAFSLPKGTYRLTGSDPNNSTIKVAVYVNGSPFSDNGEGVNVTVPYGATVYWQIRVLANASANNLTLYPMLRDASIQDDTYVPYGMSNVELTRYTANQSDSRGIIQSMSVLSDTIEPGRYYGIALTDVPTGVGSPGYVDVIARKDFENTLRCVKYQPYNSYDYYVNMKQNSTTWSGWRKFSGTAL